MVLGLAMTKPAWKKYEKMNRCPSVYDIALYLPSLPMTWNQMVQCLLANQPLRWAIPWRHMSSPLKIVQTPQQYNKEQKEEPRAFWKTPRTEYRNRMKEGLYPTSYLYTAGLKNSMHSDPCDLSFKLKIELQDKYIRIKCHPMSCEASCVLDTAHGLSRSLCQEARIGAMVTSCPSAS